MPENGPKVIWLAYGVDGSWERENGPVVVVYETTAEKYAEMGWDVYGPYVVENRARMPKTKRARDNRRKAGRAVIENG